MTRRPSPVRVLHLRDSPWIDGPGRTILETASRIDRSRVDYHVGVLVVSPVSGHPLLGALRARELPVHEIVDDGSSLKSVAMQVGELVDRLGIEILHSSDFRTNIIAVLCRRGRQLKIVSTAHGWIANTPGRKAKVAMDRMLLRRFDRVILVSHAMRKKLPRWWVPDARATVLHNALAFERFPSDDSGADVRPKPRGRDAVLLNVGRLSAEKGQALLLRAVAALGKDHPGVTVNFAGIGPLKAELVKLAHDLDIASKVNFLGYVEDMAEVYRASSLVVQSSFTEGLPNVVLEAAWLGVPIVATDVGGTPEVIEHGVSGWLVRPRSLDDLAAGIRHFLENRAEFDTMTRAARERIERDFSIGARTAGQEGVYEALAAPKPSGMRGT